MNSHRTTDGSGRPVPGGARRGRVAIALILAIGTFAGVAPAPASDSSGHGNGRGHSERGDRAPQQPPADAAAPAVSAGPVVPEPVAEPVQPAASTLRRGSSRGKGPRGSGSSHAASSSNSSSNAGRPPTSSGTSSGSGRGPREQQIVRPAQAAPARPAQTAEDSDAAVSEDLAAVAAAAPAAPVAAAPAVPAVAAVTPPVAVPASAAPRRRTKAATRRRTPTARRTAAAPTAPSPRAALPVPGPVTTTAAPASSATTRKSKADSESPSPVAPITRTVVRVLEVIPIGLRIALGVLAGLGLLLGAATVVQTRRRRSVERQRKLLLADVGVLQSALLPNLPERIAGARVTAAYIPADGLAAGGDFYDAFELPGGRTGVVVGDIAGHGRDAIPLTALVRFNLRAYLEAGLSPRAALHVGGNVLKAQLGGRQVTIVVAIFDPGSGRLTYACAGHWPPLLLGMASEHVTACSSPPIGAGAATGRRQTTIALPPGATACFYTDGLLEARDGDERLGEGVVAEELRSAGARGTAADLLAAIVRRSDSQPDDMAACILTALPGGAAGWSMRIEELEVDATALTRGGPAQFLRACGVGEPHLANALRRAARIVGRCGTAVIEVRVGEELAEVHVNVPPAHTLLAERRLEEPPAMAATG